MTKRSTQAGYPPGQVADIPASLLSNPNHIVVTGWSQEGSDFDNHRDDFDIGSHFRMRVSNKIRIRRITPSFPFPTSAPHRPHSSQARLICCSCCPGAAASTPHTTAYLAKLRAWPNLWGGQRSCLPLCQFRLGTTHGLHRYQGSTRPALERKRNKGYKGDKGERLLAGNRSVYRS